MRNSALIVMIILLATDCKAQVTATTDANRWQATVGTYNTITFDDYPVFTTITNQYAELGVEFTDGNDHIGTVTLPPPLHQSLVSTDGFGNHGTIHASFSTPQYWLALDLIGAVRVEFYTDGALVFTSNQYIAGFTPFVGFVSTTPFDAVVISDNDPTVAIDNLYFGPPIPAPGPLAMMVLVAFARTRRRADLPPCNSPACHITPPA